MRKNKTKIEQFAFRLGTLQKRVGKFAIVTLSTLLRFEADWIQAITGIDVGPIPEKYQIHNRPKEGDCCFCGYPLFDDN